MKRKALLTMIVVIILVASVLTGYYLGFFGNPRHEVIVSSVTAPNLANQGDSVSISIVALNNGTETETFGINVTDDGTFVQNQNVTSLAAGNTTTLTFTWNTAGDAAGNHTITSTVVPAAGQTNLKNNSMSTTVQLLAPSLVYDFYYAILNQNGSFLNWNISVPGQVSNNWTLADSVMIQPPDGSLFRQFKAISSKVSIALEWEQGASLTVNRTLDGAYNTSTYPYTTSSQRLQHTDSVTFDVDNGTTFIVQLGTTEGLVGFLFRVRLWNAAETP